MGAVRDLITYLNSPQLVAKFQKSFGIEARESCQTEFKQGALHYTSSRERPGNGSTEQPSDESEDSSSSSSAESVNKPGYEVRNAFWYWLFTFGTALGDEVFYASVFPFWFWNIDGAVGRRITTVWALSMYIGQCLKDIICWPRPACPPVFRLEQRWALEYGMPSTHAMVSATVPFAVILYTMNRYEYSLQVGILSAVLWCVLVSSSRLYLGMHSVLDIIAGFALAFLLLAVLTPLADQADAFLLTHPTSPALIVTTVVTLVLVYPVSQYTTAKEDTTVIIGAAGGLLIGSWISFQLGSIRGPSIPPPYAIIWPSYEMLGISLFRTVIGLTMVVATRAIFKTISYAGLQALVKSLHGSNQWSKDKVNSSNVFVVLGCKLITYAAIGINVTWLSPAVFRLLGIERPSFHTEI